MRYGMIATLFCLTTIGHTQKLVLIEQFTNASCGSCATYTPQVIQFADGNPDEVITIAYHLPFPGLDSMYFESKNDVDGRMEFYDIISVPTSIVDGNYFAGSSFNLLSEIDVIITERAAMISGFSIDFKNINFSQNTIGGQIKVRKDDTSNVENINLHIVLVEKLVLKSAYSAVPGTNNENKYNYVMRKMLPSANGNNLSFTNNIADVLFSWEQNNFKNEEELRIIAFLQHTETKEIVQANYYDINETTINSGFTAEEISLYPNPVKGFLNS